MNELQTRLQTSEQIIESGLKTFVEVGNALMSIRDERLYREQYPTFEAYCRERWSWSSRHVNRQIEAAQIAGAVGPIGPVPSTESQARELSRLKEPEAIRETWQEVTSSNPQPTARDIRQAVERRINPRQEYVCTECGQVHETRECPDCVQVDEVQQMDSLFQIVGDPRGNIARASLRLAYLTAVKSTREHLIPLDPDQVADVLDTGELDSTRWFIHDMRRWLDRFERTVSRGLHVVEVGS